ncbi:hypothetical protein EFD56_28365 [Rhizobium phaseoli]|nr:hypothetical protein CO650_08615 [Rhizobium phaseoli]RUM13454.1 hypothetical protein EFD56_28365 [Rhizobium phaseoli]
MPSQGNWRCRPELAREGDRPMATNSIPDSAKLPPKSLNEDTEDAELPEVDVDEQRKPPASMGSSREAGDGLTDADPKTGRADQKDRIPAPQFSNRE